MAEMTAHHGEDLWLEAVVEHLSATMKLKRPVEIDTWVDLGAPAIAGSMFVAVMPGIIRFDDTDFCLIDELGVNVAVILRSSKYPRDRRGAKLINGVLTPACRRIVRELHMNYEIAAAVNNRLREFDEEEESPGYWHPLKAASIGRPQILQGASFEVSQTDEAGLARTIEFRGAKR